MASPSNRSSLTEPQSGSTTTQLGSTRLITDTTGAQVGTYNYDTYGRTTNYAGSVGSVFQYRGPVHR